MILDFLFHWLNISKWSSVNILLNNTPHPLNFTLEWIWGEKLSLILTFQFPLPFNGSDPRHQYTPARIATQAGQKKYSHIISTWNPLETFYSANGCPVNFRSLLYTLFLKPSLQYPTEWFLLRPIGLACTPSPHMFHFILVVVVVGVICWNQTYSELFKKNPPNGKWMDH